LRKAAEVEADEDEITANDVRLSRVLEGLHTLKGDLLLKKNRNQYQKTTCLRHQQLNRLRQIGGL
jgi:hypothetical protein